MEATAEEAEAALLAVADPLEWTRQKVSAKLGQLEMHEGVSAMQEKRYTVGRNSFTESFSEGLPVYIANCRLPENSTSPVTYSTEEAAKKACQHHAWTGQWTTPPSTPKTGANRRQAIQTLPNPHQPPPA
jgi:hypothetical protein